MTSFTQPDSLVVDEDMYGAKPDESWLMRIWGYGAEPNEARLHYLVDEAWLMRPC